MKAAAVSPRPLTRILLWSQRALLAAGLSLLAWCGFVLVDSWLFQRQERHQFERQLAGQRQASLFANFPVPVPGGLIGRLEIPRLGVSVFVMEGVGAVTLRHAIGHIPGTALPGEAANIGISGHRDTFFRPLRKILRDDIITLTTPRGVYRYRVVSTKTVLPSDVAVLEAGTMEVLTLVTCYPFYFVGASPDRFIVRAERVT